MSPDAIGYAIIAFIIGFILIYTAGALVLLFIGIHMLRKQKTGAGTFLTSIGALGTIITLSVIALILGGVFYFKGNTSYDFDGEYKSETFNPDTYKGSLGNVCFPFKGESVLREIQDDSNTEVIYNSKDGTFKVPAGVHEFESYEITIADPKDGKWTASSWEINDFTNTVKVPDNANTEIVAGPPFTARISFKEKSDGTISFSLKYADAKNNPFSISFPEKSSLTPPGFEVFSASGEKLWSGEFKYG